MKKFLALFLTVLMALCTFPASLAEDEMITINWMIENRSENELDGFQKCVIEPFEAEFPNIKINLIPTADTRNVLRVQLSAGQGPDLCCLDGPTDAQELFAAGRLMDLAPYYEKYGWSEILADWAENTVKAGDAYAGIPIEVEAMWLWYNTDLFAEYGWEVPTTYEELVAICEASMENGYTALAFGNSNAISDIDHWLSTAYNLYAGVEDLKAALRGEKKWTDDTLKGSIQILNDMWQAGYINDKQSYAVSNDDARTLFYSGMATMKMEGSWLYGMLLSNAEVNYAVDMFPKLRDDVDYALPMGLGGAWGVNAAASPEVADACAELINFMLTRTDLHIEQMINHGLNPLPIDLPIEAFPEGTDPCLLKMIEGLNEAQANLESSGLVLWTFFPPELRQWQIDNMDKVFLGEMTVDEFCEGTQEVFDKCLANGTVPPLP